MRAKILPIISLSFFILVIPQHINAELSVTSQWRLEEAIHKCKETGNALDFPDYWGATVTDENRETVCMAEQFAQLVVLDGEDWLQNKSGKFIDQCKDESKGDNKKYYGCLQAGLKQATDLLSPSCEELGKEGLWEAPRCKRLVSYIFIKEFDKVLQSKKPFIEKFMRNKIFKILFSPFGAIVVLLLYVLDLVFLADPGNWSRVPKFGFIVGSIILVAWFLKGQIRFIILGSTVLVCAGGVIVNHVKVFFKPDNEKSKYSKRSRGVR